MASFTFVVTKSRKNIASLTFQLSAASKKKHATVTFIAFEVPQEDQHEPESRCRHEFENAFPHVNAFLPQNVSCRAHTTKLQKIHLAVDFARCHCSVCGGASLVCDHLMLVYNEQPPRRSFGWGYSSSVSNWKYLPNRSVNYD